MCSFITQHNATDVAGFEGTLRERFEGLQECPPELLLRCCCELNVHFSTISASKDVSGLTTADHM